MESILQSYFWSNPFPTGTAHPEKKEQPAGTPAQSPQPTDPNDLSNHSRYVEVVNFMYRFTTTLG